MTSPAVEVVRDIPLKTINGDYDENTGFPFDKDFDRNRDTQGRFRSQLDDLTKHIPSEFAQHFSGGFPFNSSSRADPEFRRFTEDFPAEFEDLGFSFPRNHPRAQHYYQQQPPQPEYYPTQEEFYQQNPHQQYYQEPAQEFYQPPAGQQEYYQQNPAAEASCSKQEASGSEQGRAGDSLDKGKNNLQQSNTVDLGQQQEPVNDRSQRSMSAPPENRPRFKTSINIPMNSNNAGGENAAQQPQTESKQQPQQQQQGGKPIERVIPIHIEGRDGPFVPTPPPSYTRSTNANYAPPPEPETIFGRGFMRQPEPRRGWFHDEDPFMRTRSPFQDRPYQQQYAAPPQQRPPPQQHQQHHPQQQQQQPQRAPPKQQQTPPQPQPQPQQQPQQQPQKQATPPPQQPPKPLTPLEQIEAIHKDVAQLKTQIDNFTGKTKDKNYLFLDEMLTRNMLKLDNIDTQGQDAIRTARKEAIRFVQKCADDLEKKVTENAKETAPMEVENKAAEEPQEKAEPEKMETEKSADTKPEEPQPQQQQPEKEKSAEPMEVCEETRAVLVTEPQKTETTEAPAEKAAENSEVAKPENSEDNKPSADSTTQPIEKPQPNPEQPTEPATDTTDDKPATDDKKEKKKIKKKTDKK